MFQQKVSQITCRMKGVGYPDKESGSFCRLVTNLSQRGVKNIQDWLSEILRSVTDPEQYLDIRTQGWLALVFSSNGFTIKMNPFGESGPDLLVGEDGRDMFVEVCRIRTDQAQIDHLTRQNSAAVPFGDLEKDIKKVIDEIVGKKRQSKNIPVDKPYVVAIYSDKESVEELEFQKACKSLSEEASNGGGRYERISAVLFYDRYTNIRTGTRWYVWVNPNGSVALEDSTARLFRSMRLPD